MRQTVSAVGRRGWLSETDRVDRRVSLRATGRPLIVGQLQPHRPVVAGVTASAAPDRPGRARAHPARPGELGAIVVFVEERDDRLAQRRVHRAPGAGSRWSARRRRGRPRRSSARPHARPCRRRGRGPYADRGRPAGEQILGVHCRDRRRPRAAGGRTKSWVMLMVRSSCRPLLGRGRGRRARMVMADGDLCRRDALELPQYRTSVRITSSGSRGRCPRLGDVDDLHLGLEALPRISVRKALPKSAISMLPSCRSQSPPFPSGSSGSTSLSFTAFAVR